MSGVGTDPLILALAMTHLEEEEGRVPHAYRDHLGCWTIGVGRMIDVRKGGGLTDSEIDLLLENDVRGRAALMGDWPAWHRVRHDPVRATALLSMCFQMGAAGLARFDATLKAVGDGRFDEAATEMLDSLWAQQTPERAKRISGMMRTGEMP